MGCSDYNDKIIREDFFDYNIRMSTEHRLGSGHYTTPKRRSDGTPRTKEFEVDLRGPQLRHCGAAGEEVMAQLAHQNIARHPHLG